MLKTTTRYKLNKLISETPTDSVQFALDVNINSLPEAHRRLKKIAETNSFTLIVIPNKSRRGIL